MVRYYTRFFQTTSSSMGFSHLHLHAFSSRTVIHTFNLFCVAYHQATMSNMTLPLIDHTGFLTGWLYDGVKS